MYHIDDIPSMHDVGIQHGHQCPFYPMALQRPLHDGILFALRLRTSSPTCQDELILPIYIGSSNPKEPRCCFSYSGVRTCCGKVPPPEEVFWCTISVRFFCVKCKRCLV